MASRRVRPSVSDRYGKKGDRAFLDLARKRFKQSTQADVKQREREREDLEFYAGDQWDPAVVEARAGGQGNAIPGVPRTPPRPTYVINKVRAPVRQVLNAERQAELGIEITAVDDFGDDTGGVSPQEIELREGLTRRIQRESQAQDARSWAFARATIAGRGYYRVMTRYAPGKTHDQEVYVERIYNQASVSLDPTHEQPDGSDAEWGFIGTDLPWERYRQEYGVVGDKPNALIATDASEWRALGDELPGWFSVDGDLRSVRIVEHWFTERTSRTLHQLADGSSVYDDELPEDAEVVASREVVEKQIKWAKLDGVQVLEETEWDGHYLPIVKVIGEEIQPYDSERRVEGMVRPARDSQRSYNVMVSKWVEQIGLAPIPPWMGAAGFDEGFEAEYALANTRTLAALHYNTKDLEGNPIGPPTRTSITMEIQAIAGSVQLFDACIKDTTAIPDPTLGNVDPSLKSGRAIKQVLDQATQGTAHYLSNLARSIRYEGLIINDLLYPIYGRPGRIVRTLTAGGDTQAMMLHRPFVRHPDTQQPLAQMGGQPVTPATPDAVTMTLTPDATFNVTVKVTKNYDTRREAQEALLTSLIEADPQQMAVIGDLVFKYNDGPGHEELEKRYQAMLAPPVAALVNGQPQIPPQLQAQIAQMQQQMQQLQQVADKNRTDLAKTQMQEQGETQRAQAENQVTLQKAELAATATMSVAQAKIDAENFRSYVDAIETRLGKTLDLHLQKLTQVHEAVQQASAQRHDVGVMAMEHAHERDMAQQQQAHALEQGAQQAALAPQNPNAQETA